MTPFHLFGGLASDPWWTLPGTCAAVILLLLAIRVPGGAGLAGEEDRRARAGSLVRAGGWAWGLFHAWAAWRLVEYQGEIRSLGWRVTPGDHGLGLSLVGQASSGGWACLAGSVLLAGIVLRGTRTGWWMPWALLAGLGGAVAGSLTLFREERRSAWPHPSLWVAAPWEDCMLPLFLLLGLSALLVCFSAMAEILRAGRAGNAAAREVARLRLGGAGLVLLSIGAIGGLVSLHSSAQQVALLGPRLTPKDLDYYLTRPYVVPAVVALLGLLAAAFGLFHLRRPREGGSMGADPRS